MRDTVLTTIAILSILALVAGLADSTFFIVAIALFALFSYIDTLPQRSDKEPESRSEIPPMLFSGSRTRTEPTLSDKTELTLFMLKKKEYLKSSEWATKRALIFIRDNYKCQSCSIDTDLNIHHISYKNLGNEPLDELICLCQDCHTALHERVGYPKTYKEYMDFYGPLK